MPGSFFYYIYLYNIPLLLNPVVSNVYFSALLATVRSEVEGCTVAPRNYDQISNLKKNDEMGSFARDRF